MTSVVPGGPSPLSYTAHVRPSHTHPSKLKPAMPPPLPSVRSQHPAPQPVSNSARIPVKIDKQAPPTHVGSITHGTPVNPPSVPLSQSGRFDMMPKPGIGKEGGSITQGTPMHPDQKRSAASLYKDGCTGFEPRPGSGVEIIPRPYEREPYRGQRPPISSAPPTAYYSSNYVYRSPFTESRQIIAHDFEISQQMINKRVPDKEPRVSPHARDRSPQQDPRDRVSGATTVSRIIDNPRGIDQRTLDIRPVDHHRSLEMSRIDRNMDPRLEHRPALDHRMVERINASDPRYYQSAVPHGSYQPTTQSSAAVYHQERVSRPPSLPASVRDPTPASPTIEPAPSPHDFRSPGISTPTPPRAGVIQRHPTSKQSTHLAPPTSASPRTDVDRYSPRHVAGDEAFQAFVNIAVAQQRTGDYPPPQVRGRDGRPKHHDSPQPEGFEKQIADSVREYRASEREKHDMRAVVDGRGPPPPQPDNRRYFDHRQDYRIMTKNPEKKTDMENDAVVQGLVSCFKKEEPKPAPPPKGNSRNQGPGNETLTAANLIDAIITHQINNTSGDGGAGGGGNGVGASDQRTIRREGDGGLQVEIDKHVRSPATAQPKEKEVVMVDDNSPDTRPSPNPLNHKDGVGTYHSAPHHQGSQPKSIQAHMDQIIHRAYNTGDGRKIEAPHMPYGRPPFEILRTDGRSIVGSGGPPAVTVSQVGGYDPWKMRGHDKDGKDRIDSRSPHRPPSSAQSATHHISAQHLGPDERQIIRIAQQPVSPRPDHKMRTPPAAQAGSFPVESISPPTSSAPPTSDPNHTDSNMQWQHTKRPPYQTKEVFEYVRHKIAEVMRTPDTQEGEKRVVDDGRHPQSGAPVSQLQHPQQPPPPPQQSVSQQNAHYDLENASKKRPRLETGDRPPSRPRSTGGDMVKERREDAPIRDEVADSPQSGEMVIDESPRDSHPPTSKSGDMSGGKGGSKGDTNERSGYPPVSAGNQYSYSYSGFRGHGPPGVGGPGVSPSTTSSTTSSNSSGGRPHQGYEPHVEPVSEED